MNYSAPGDFSRIHKALDNLRKILKKDIVGNLRVDLSKQTKERTRADWGRRCAICCVREKGKAKHEIAHITPVEEGGGGNFVGGGQVRF